MTENEKEIVQQIAAITVASADLTASLVMWLIRLQKVSPGEALLILGDLAEHQRDLATRNTNIPGMAVAFRQIADRLDVHSDQLQKDTGATIQPGKHKPD